MSRTCDERDCIVCRMLVREEAARQCEIMSKELSRQAVLRILASPYPDENDW